jgi:hypothetical protein
VVRSLLLVVLVVGAPSKQWPLRYTTHGHAMSNLSAAQTQTRGGRTPGRPACTPAPQHTLRRGHFMMAGRVGVRRFGAQDQTHTQVFASSIVAGH